MKKKAIDSILSFINRYRAVTFGALRMNIPHISDETIFSDTTRLCKRRLISYEKKNGIVDRIGCRGDGIGRVYNLQSRWTCSHANA